MKCTIYSIEFEISRNTIFSVFHLISRDSKMIDNNYSRDSPRFNDYSLCGNAFYKKNIESSTVIFLGTIIHSLES